MKQKENALNVLADFVTANEIVCYSCGSSCTRQKNA
jgi:hypothetical protein